MEQERNQIQTSKPQETQLAKPNRSYLNKYVHTNEEKELVKACEDVRIKDIKKEDAERLIEVVGKWGFYMGASARQSSEDILLICKFLRDNYEMLTINEINLAINLNLRGSLGNNEFFGHLSPLYISQVLNAYNDYKQEVVKPLIQRKERDSYTPTPELTKEENYKMICDAIRYEYGKFKAKKDINDMFSIIYDFMHKSGRLSTNEELIEDARGYASNMVEKLKTKTAKNLGDLMQSSQSEEAQFKSYYRSYILMDLFSKINDIDAYISGIKLEETT
jgi:hypothetical protein